MRAQVQVREECAQVQMNAEVQKRGGARGERGREQMRGRAARTFSETIAAFDRTPPGIVCPHFVELRWAFGCPYSCQWCYLMGTSFGRKHFRAYPIGAVLAHLKRAFRIMEPTLFNSGELSDSMPDHPNMIRIVQAFASDDNARHRLLLVTKSGPPLVLSQWLLSGREAARRAREAIVYSASLNAPSVAARWERGAPPVEARIEGLRLMSLLGVEVRARVDPIVPVEGWKKEYGELLRKIAVASEGANEEAGAIKSGGGAYANASTGTNISAGAPAGAGTGAGAFKVEAGAEVKVKVKRITLGTLRGLPRTLTFARKLGCDLSWAKYLKERTAWGLRMPREERVEVYGYCIDVLRECGFKGDIGVCKETEDVVRELGLTDLKCNCMW